MLVPEERVSSYQETQVVHLSHVPCRPNLTDNLLHYPAVRTTVVCGLFLSTGGFARGQASNVCHHQMIHDLYIIPSVTSR